VKRGVQEILGKTIAGVVLSENKPRTKGQLLLAFSDETFFEFRGSDLAGAAGLDPGGVKAAVSYARLSGCSRLIVHPPDLPAGAPDEGLLIAQNPVEKGFLGLAAEWQAAAVEAGNDRVMPVPADLAGMACILIALERWELLGPAAKQAMRRNVEQRAKTCFKGCDGLVWELCLACCEKDPSKTGAFVALRLLMGHSNSNLRLWGMKLGWLVRDRLPPKVIPVLLGNIANTLGAVDQSVGLAVARCGSPEAFLEAADAFEPPEDFEDQYRNRIARVRELGTNRYQTSFLAEEVQVRKLLEDRCFAP